MKVGASNNPEMHNFQPVEQDKLQNKPKADKNREVSPTIQTRYEGITTYAAIQKDLKYQVPNLGEFEIIELKGKFKKETVLNDEGKLVYGESVVADSVKVGDDHFFKFDVSWTAKVKIPPDGEEKTVTFSQTIFTNVKVPEGGSAKELESAKQEAFLVAKSYELTQKNLTKVNTRSSPGSEDAARFNALKTENKVLFTRVAENANNPNPNPVLAQHKFTAMSSETRTSLPINYTKKRVADVAQSEIAKITSMSSKQIILQGDSKFARFEDVEKGYGEAGVNEGEGPELLSFLKEKAEIHKENFMNLLAIGQSQEKTSGNIINSDEFKEKQADLTESKKSSNQAAAGTSPHFISQGIHDNEALVHQTDLKNELIAKAEIPQLEKTLEKMKVIEKNHDAVTVKYLEHLEDGGASKEELNKAIGESGRELAHIESGVNFLEGRIKELKMQATTVPARNGPAQEGENAIAGTSAGSVVENPRVAGLEVHDEGALLNPDLETEIIYESFEDSARYDSAVAPKGNFFQELIKKLFNSSEAEPAAKAGKSEKIELFLDEVETDGVISSQSEENDIENTLKSIYPNISQLSEKAAQLNSIKDSDDKFIQTEALYVEIDFLKEILGDLHAKNTQEGNQVQSEWIKNCEKIVNNVEKGINRNPSFINEEIVVEDRNEGSVENRPVGEQLKSAEKNIGDSKNQITQEKWDNFLGKRARSASVDDSDKQMRQEKWENFVGKRARSASVGDSDKQMRQEKWENFVGKRARSASVDDSNKQIMQEKWENFIGKQSKANSGAEVRLEEAPKGAESKPMSALNPAEFLNDQGPIAKDMFASLKTLNESVKELEKNPAILPEIKTKLEELKSQIEGLKNTHERFMLSHSGISDLEKKGLEAHLTLINNGNNIVNRLEARINTVEEKIKPNTESIVKENGDASLKEAEKKEEKSTTSNQSLRSDIIANRNQMREEMKNKKEAKIEELEKHIEGLKNQNEEMKNKKAAQAKELENRIQELKNKKAEGQDDIKK